MIRAIYAHGDEEIGADAETSMRRYLTEHPHGEHGRHEYDLESLGLEAADLEGRLTAYRRRFEIAHDGAGIDR